MVSGISNTNSINKLNNHVPVARVQTNPALQTDTVNIEQKKKKKLSKGAKWALGVVGTFGTLAAAGLAFVAHKRNQIAKLYKEKLVLSNLGENLQFQEAATVEEGIKFAKEVLKIKEVDSNISLDAINEANKGLVKVSNANKGQLFMPTALRYVNEPSANWYAHVNRNIQSEKFGELTLNSSFFEHARLDEGLNRDLFCEDGAKAFKKLTGGNYNIPVYDRVACTPKKDVMDLIQKYYASSDSLTIPEKRTLYYSILKGIHTNGSVYKRSPISFLKKLEANPKYKTFFENNKPNYEELSKKTTAEQAAYVEDILKKMMDENNVYINHIEIIPSESTIYHEMGHLQDYAKNLKELDLAKWKYSNMARILKDSWGEAQKGKKSSDKLNTLDEIGNHWGSIHSDKELKKFFNEHPDDFKKCYPDLHEFLTTQEIQQTAGEISAYAQSGIGEFIAEVYKEMVQGKPISDKVKALYEKYNGPKLP